MSNYKIACYIQGNEEFLAWSQEACRQRDLCLAGQLPFDSLVAWLDYDCIK